jgi:hypothetical protein
VANAVPPVELPGLVVKTSLDAVPGVMAKALLSADVSEPSTACSS